MTFLSSLHAYCRGNRQFGVEMGILGGHDYAVRPFTTLTLKLSSLAHVLLPPIVVRIAGSVGGHVDGREPGPPCRTFWSLVRGVSLTSGRPICQRWGRDRRAGKRFPDASLPSNLNLLSISYVVGDTPNLGA